MVFFTFILSLMLGLIAPASTTANSAAIKNVETAKNSTVAAEQLAWSPSRRLSWEDFKGNPDSLDTHHAMTAANLAVDAKCNGTKFNYTVRCVFLPTESWSKNKKSERLLQHEQMHFDLTEVHARQLRKKLQALGSSCSNVQSKLNETVSAAFAEWKAEQRKFDHLSDHGLRADVSQAWASDIEIRLKKLERYK